MKLQLKLNFDGRQCSCCKQYKYWSDFPKDKHNKYGHASTCKTCRNLAKIQYRQKDGIRELEIQYKRKFRQTDIGRLRTQFDNLYYTDKQVKKNREIIKNIRDISRKESKLSKIDYFVSRGFSLDKLKEIYNIGS